MNRKPPILVFWDVDGTLTEERSSWEYVHKALGTWESHGAPALQLFLEGKIDYDEFARRDAGAWSGVSLSQFIEILSEMPLRDGVIEIMDHLRILGAKQYIVSSGLAPYAELLCEKLRLDGFFANELEVVNEKLTGKVITKVPWGGKKKIAKHLKKEISPSFTIAFGDSETDEGLFIEADYSVAICPRDEKVTKIVDYNHRLSSLHTLIPHIDELLKK